MLKHIKEITPKLIKQAISIQAYYKKHLKGGLGKTTGNGWHRWNGLCPFHADRKAGSFYLNIENGAFKCFSCGAKGGDVFSFHQKLYNKSFVEALKDLGSEAPHEKE